MGNIPLEIIMLVSAVLLFVSIFASKASSRFGVPALLLFLMVGMAFGSDVVGIPFDNVQTAQAIGTLALCIILFSGGFETSFREIRPVMAPGIVLATAGVLMTALLTGLFIWGVATGLYRGGLIAVELSFLESLLMASVMSSTDSASVFSILRTKKQGLKQHLRPLLELESGSNDPMAYILTIMLLGLIGQGDAPNWWLAVGQFAMQMSIGALMGYLLGRMIVWTINRINLSNTSLYGIMLLAMALFVFALTDTAHGNGYLAVYIAGLVVGNKKIILKKPLTNFLDGFTWLFQIIMFLSLGLLVSPRELFTSPGTIIIGVVVGVFMILVARPVSVLGCMAPFYKKFTPRALGYVSWVGLRGAVPIIFATYPLVAVADGFSPVVADLIFNVVFFITILSLVIQGSTVSWMAGRLGLARELPQDNFGIDLPDKIKSALSEIEVREAFLTRGNSLKDISLPAHTLVVMVKRGEDYFVPRGNTVLELGDKLLVFSDNDTELKRELARLGIEV